MKLNIQHMGWLLKIKWHKTLKKVTETSSGKYFMILEKYGQTL